MPALLSAALLRLLPCSRRRYAGGGRHEQTAFGGFYIIDEESGASSESEQEPETPLYTPLASPPLEPGPPPATIEVAHSRWRGAPSSALPPCLTQEREEEETEKDKGI
uniref:Uncharacterized protein n=1 Tax=Oryza nivara TaxID=4536 RepID=A0A0E0HYX1_ORYNI